LGEIRPVGVGPRRSLSKAIHGKKQHGQAKPKMTVAPSPLVLCEIAVEPKLSADQQLPMPSSVGCREPRFGRLGHK